MSLNFCDSSLTQGGFLSCLRLHDYKLSVSCLEAHAGQVARGMKQSRLFQSPVTYRVGAAEHWALVSQSSSKCLILGPADIYFVALAGLFPFARSCLSREPSAALLICDLNSDSEASGLSATLECSEQSQWKVAGFESGRGFA